MYIDTVSILLVYFPMFVNGWVLMCALGCLIPCKKGYFRRFLLFLSCSLLGTMVIFIGDAFNILATIPFFLAAVFFACEGSRWQRITIGAMYASTIFSFNALRDNYLDTFLLNRFRKLSYWHVHGLSMLCSILFAVFLYWGIHKYAPDRDYVLSDNLWKLLFLLTATPFGIVLSLTTLFDFGSPHSTALAGFPAECFVLLVIALLSFISLLWCITILARQQKLERQIMFAEMNRRYYESMEQQHFELRRLKHDLANHLQTLCALPEKQRDAYLRRLVENTAVSETLSYCGDATVNAVLTVKKNLMDRYGIRLETTLDIPSTLPFHETDLCALFANALDNAVEACLQTDDGKRLIQLKTKAQKGLFCLEIKNPLPDAALAASDNLPPDHIWTTSKPDKTNHGIGLRSIREIVERYGGSLEIKATEGMFDLFLYIPLFP